MLGIGVICNFSTQYQQCSENFIFNFCGIKNLVIFRLQENCDKVK